MIRTFIALFRGINVGGKGILPMKELVAILERLGLKNVKTYIQSGNAVFKCKESDTAKLSNKISSEIKKRRGFEPRLLLLGIDEFEKSIKANPFPEAESEPATLHLNFLAAIPQNPNLKALDEIKKPNERFALRKNIFYLHAPDGIGKSKLAANIERHLGVPATSRNWRTICRILELAKEP